MIREIQRLGWLDEKTNPKMRNWIKNQLVGKMGKDYSFDVKRRNYESCFRSYLLRMVGVDLFSVVNGKVVTSLRTE